MKPASSTFSSPITIEEALAALADVSGDGTSIAAATNLVPVRDRGPASPAHLADTQDAAGLGTAGAGAGMRVEALTRRARVEADERARSACPLRGRALCLVQPSTSNR